MKLSFPRHEEGTPRPTSGTDNSSPNESIELGAVADLQMVRQVLNGDGNAYRTLIERYQGRVARIMWQFSRDPEVHKELIQEVFVQAYESLGSFRAKAPFEHWLARIATRVGYRYWKREKSKPQTVALEEIRELAEEPPNETEPAVTAELVYRLLAHLSPRDRLVLTLRYIENRSVEETAELTGWSPTMVKVQTWRARRRLQKLLEKARQEP
ncbi:MAG: RNA polymerase sigma factor [Candidatus Zipacnadales bacterium]